MGAWHARHAPFKSLPWAKMLTPHQESWQKHFAASPAWATHKGKRSCWGWFVGTVKQTSLQNCTQIQIQCCHWFPLLFMNSFTQMQALLVISFHTECTTISLSANDIKHDLMTYRIGLHPTHPQTFCPPLAILFFLFSVSCHDSCL